MINATSPENFIWVEKWRPKKIEDTILPKETKEMAKGYISQGRIPNLLFHGGAGVGKTTLARAMCDEIGCDYIIINASNENGIDMLRTKVTSFASTNSFSDAKKVIILDEADYLTPQVQAAFRNAMEEFSVNCSFILTCNFPNRIVDPIHSRCGVVTFKIPKTEQATLASQFFKRVSQILVEEGVEFDRKVVAELVQKYFPDFRRCLNELQKFSATGKIDSAILLNMGEESFNVLISTLKEKKFNSMRQWVAENSDIEPVQLYRMFYDSAVTHLEPKSIPEMIMTLADYQFKSSQVMDQEINTAAFLTEVMMGNIKWK